MSPNGHADAGHTRAGVIKRLLLVSLASVVLGAATSWAQTLLPTSMSSFANSASGWTALTACLVVLAAVDPKPGALAGLLGFLGLVVGYTIASRLRGFAYTPTTWLAVAVVAGPMVGAAAALASRSSGFLALAGASVLAFIFITDGVRGLSVLSGTTSPVYWNVAIGAGATLMLWAVARAATQRSRRSGRQI
jgi:hypothetical protein